MPSGLAVRLQYGLGLLVSDRSHRMPRTPNAVRQRRNDTGAPASQLSALLAALQAVRDGDFSVRLPGDWIGLEGKIADTFNGIVAANARIAGELERVGTVVGKQGKTRQRVKFGS